MAFVGGEGVQLSGPTPESLLLDALRKSSGTPGLRFVSPPERMTGGFWAEIWAVAIADGPADLNGNLVVRVMPDNAVAQREIVVQNEVVRQGFPAPAVRLAGEIGDGLRRPFVVMDRAKGRPPLPEPTGPAALAGMGRAAIRLPDLLARTSALLHVLDSAALRSKLEELEGPVVDVLDLLRLLGERATEAERPDLERAARLMPRTRPPSEREAICHGDLHPFNLLVDGERVTVIDWTVSLVADPAFDLSFTAMTMAMAPIDVPRALRRPIRAAARQGSRQFLRRYLHHAPQAEASLADDMLQWYGAVHCLRALVQVAGWIATGMIDDRAGHPWLLMAPQMAVLLSEVVGETVRPM